MKHGSDVRLNDFSHSLSSIQWNCLMFSLSLPSFPHPTLSRSFIIFFSDVVLNWHVSALEHISSRPCFVFFLSVHQSILHSLIFLSLSVYQCLYRESQLFSCPDLFYSTYHVLIHIAHCGHFLLSCVGTADIYTFVICDAWALPFSFLSSFILRCTVN